jgi:hypothetical protein
MGVSVSGTQLLKLGKITEATVEILDRFRHPGFSAFQGQPIEPNDTTGREKLAVYTNALVSSVWGSLR